MNRLFPILALAGLCAAALPVRAMNLIPLLQDTPAQFYDDEDYALFDGALKKALNELAANGISPWQNQKTGAGGVITVREQFERGGKPCKWLRVESHARNRTGESMMTFCLQPDGRWMLPSP
ncbi:MAG: RT0821/Lpp0805 family surface protein [Gammaproteobacteria bacterium]|jgi:hypothetical protein|nr:RT0821/Lpp0805 family surface protein [Gammaproteobacteria bacterium]